jgi:hypothetical protein
MSTSSDIPKSITLAFTNQLDIVAGQVSIDDVS